jgi:hypothetical protein
LLNPPGETSPFLLLSFKADHEPELGEQAVYVYRVENWETGKDTSRGYAIVWERTYSLKALDSVAGKRSFSSDQ